MNPERIPVPLPIWYPLAIGVKFMQTQGPAHARPEAPRSALSFSNLSNPTTGVRVGRENRLRKVGQFRTMAAQFLAQDDVEEAAALNRMADDLEQLDDPEDEAPCHQEPDADECLGAFNKLAVVNRFDRGDFDGAEGLLLETGSLNPMQGTSKR